MLDIKLVSIRGIYMHIIRWDSQKKIIKPLQNNAQTTTCVYITSTKIHRSSKFSMISARDIIKEKRRMGKRLERGDGLLKQVLF